MSVQLSEFVDNVPGRLVLSSSTAGWKSLLVREYDQPAAVEEFWTASSPNQVVVLTVSGSCDIESFSPGSWRQARYTAGALGFTRPGEIARLRWRGAESKRTLHAHVPGPLMREVAAQLAPNQRRAGLPDALSERDGMVSSLLLALRAAVQSAAPDLYAEASAHLLAVHMLTRRNAAPARRPSLTGAGLGRVDERLRAAVGDVVSLGELADAAGMTRFQLLRAAHAAWGETPMRRLTRLRMERACELLASPRLSITEVALECGYGNSAHFATAFRRHMGATPSAYRGQQNFHASSAMSRRCRNGAKDDRVCTA